MLDTSARHRTDPNVKGLPELMDATANAAVPRCRTPMRSKGNYTNTAFRDPDQIKGDRGSGESEGWVALALSLRISLQLNLRSSRPECSHNTRLGITIALTRL